MMKPLRVEFRLAGPWCVGDEAIHLDGLVGYCKMQRAIRRGADDLRDATIESLQEDLPFEKRDGVWMASVISPNNVLHSERRLLTCKTPEKRLAELSQAGRFHGRAMSKIDTVRGPMKNAALFYTLETVDFLQAWCVGDPDQLADLLGDLSYIGRKRHLGHGRIAPDGITIVEDDDAHRYWQLRFLPQSTVVAADDFEELNDDVGEEPYLRQGRLRPPYYAMDGREVVKAMF